ncbi:hypothetical protein XENOCAPTIV_020444 [Xenoophorus captivus]|uniref:Uncharacterized protein n=1 Tax=Xenoophorus captivus TaxID=1517983 RepID=A0ABV0QKK3_9TELE
MSSPICISSIYLQTSQFSPSTSPHFPWYFYTILPKSVATITMLFHSDLPHWLSSWEFMASEENSSSLALFSKDVKTITLIYIKAESPLSHSDHLNDFCNALSAPIITICSFTLKASKL